MTLAKSSPSFESPHSNTPRDYELTYGRINITVGGASCVGTRGATEKAVLNQLVKYPRALLVAALLMFLWQSCRDFRCFPSPFSAELWLFLGYAVPKQPSKQRNEQERLAAEAEMRQQREARESVKESMKSAEIELCLGKQLAANLLSSHNELASLVIKMRRKFAKQYGFVVPDIKLSDSLAIPPKAYQIKMHGTLIAAHELDPENCSLSWEKDASPTCREMRSASRPSA